MAPATALLMAVKFGTISEINECTINGAAKRCSQKAQSARRVRRSRSEMSYRIATAKTAKPHAETQQ